LALDDKIYQLRRDKLAQIEALGQPAYPHKFSTTHAIPRIIAEYSSKTAEELESSKVEVRIAGRLMRIRLMGKAAFAHLQQAGQSLQVYVKKDAVGDKGWELFKLFDNGDHAGIRGYLFRTRTGELTVHVDETTFLPIAICPLPFLQSCRFMQLTDASTSCRPFQQKGDNASASSMKAPLCVLKRARQPPLLPAEASSTADTNLCRSSGWTAAGVVPRAHSSLR
jgi:lysyl-tRNA synthetase class II